MLVSVVCNYSFTSILVSGNCDQKDKYFFSSNCQNQTTKSGYWKESESDKKILPSLSDGIEGIRKTLVFYEGKSPNGSQTDWSMYQYRLVSSETTASNYSSQVINFKFLGHKATQQCITFKLT